MNFENGPKDSDIIVPAPANNPAHQSCIKNMNIKNHHPQNRIKTNTNVVVLQIPIKHLSSMKPKKEYALEIKKKLQKQNTHVKIK